MGKAQASQASYTVSFDANGGSYVSAQTVLEGNRAIRPSNPIRNGYEFLGWYYNNTEFNFNTRIEHDYILVARWQKVSTSYSTYCKIKNDTYYSISYVSGNKKTYSYDWTIRFDKLNTNNLKITETGYLYNYNDYNEAYIKYNNNRRIEMVNDQKEVVGKTYSVAIPSAYLFQQYSLKADNFSKSLTSPYYYNGYWYTEAQVNIRNYNNLNSSYYASEINNNIYFVPFYFKVKYTDYNSCVDDLASNWAKYSGYEIVNTYTR